jgi:hypothetical protein
MEPNETFEQQAAEPGITLDFEAQGYLREAAKWSYFLGIVGFILTGLILICAFFVGTIFSRMPQYSTGVSTAIPSAIGSFMGFIYVLVAVFYFFFSFYLYQFGYRIKNGLMYNDTLQVTNALGKLKSFFKLWGITTIVVLCFYALIILIAVIVGVGAASLLHR